MLIDLSGYSFSGKSALYDILDCLENVGGFGMESEFELLRAPGGLYDLVAATTGTPWSPVRSDAAVANFKRVAYNLGGSRSLLKDRLFRLGTYYDDLFPGYSHQIDCLLKNWVETSWEAYWPFKFFLAQPLELFAKKILLKVGFKGLETVFLSRVESDLAYNLCREFCGSLISSASATLNVEHLLLNNSFEPSSTDAVFNLVGDCIPIIIDRDPRDIYASAWLSISGPNPSGTATIGGSVDDFISRFLIYRDATIQNNKVIYMNFEDMVTDFDYLSEKLSKLNLEHAKLLNAWKKIAPHSAKNIGIWKQQNTKELELDIARISDQLAFYCK